MKKLGLFIGSFNPVHAGHTASSLKAIDSYGLERVELVVQPSNAYKIQEQLAPLNHRVAMAKLACAETNGKLQVSSFQDQITERLAASSKLSQRAVVEILSFYKFLTPTYKICILVGSDVYSTIKMWADYTEITEVADFLCLPRSIEAPSSTKIREATAVLSSPTTELNAAVLQYIKKERLYS